ncbi:zinc knuckle CX2CX4HX4C containing protein [Tanacetum coccineum]
MALQIRVYTVQVCEVEDVYHEMERALVDLGLATFKTISPRRIVKLDQVRKPLLEVSEVLYANYLEVYVIDSPITPASGDIPVVENDGVKRDGANLGSKKYSLGTKSVRGVDGKTIGAVAYPVDFSGTFSTDDDSGSNEKKVNIRTLVPDNSNDADVLILISSVLEVNDRLRTLSMGIFLVDRDLKDSMVISISNLDGCGVMLHIIKVEYEWNPPKCETCLVFGHDDAQCPKHVLTDLRKQVGTSNAKFQTLTRKAFRGLLGSKLCMMKLKHISRKVILYEINNDGIMMMTESTN